MTEWDAILNAQVIDGQLGYVVLSALRIMVAWASWLCALALIRYLHTTLPPPHTPPNLAYWLRWWLWLQLREYPLLKVGIFCTATLLLLQIPAGMSGRMNTATVYLLLIYPAWLMALAGIARLLVSIVNAKGEK